MSSFDPRLRLADIPIEAPLASGGVRGDALPAMPDPEVERGFHTLAAAVAGPHALPAGGAAGVAAITMGVALGTKVLRLSPGAPIALTAVAERLGILLDELLPEFAADCSAFEALLAALRLPADDQTRRSETIGRAWRQATEAPLRVARLAAESASLLERCVGHVNPNLAGDLTAALELVHAGARIANSNARENAAHLGDEEARQLLARLGPVPPRG